MQQKTLTVVIPTYNMEKYLRRCLDSLIVGEQQMAQLEVLVVNDGSKDSSSAIAHEYEKKYPQTFRVIDKENGNYGSCVNRGLDEAVGKYFRLLDADDRFETANFKKFLDILKTAEADMVMTNYCHVFEGNDKKKILIGHPKGIEYGKVYKADDFDFSKFECESLCVMHSLTFKLAVLKKVGLRHQTGISYTDVEYDYFPWVGVKTILPLDIWFYLYTVGRNGQTVSAHSMAKSIDNYYKVSRRLLDDFTSCPENKINMAIRAKQLVPLSRILITYIRLVLCNKKNDEEFIRMKVLYHDIEVNVPEMLPQLQKECSKRALFSYKIWQNLRDNVGKFPLNIIYGMLLDMRAKIKGVNN